MKAVKDCTNITESFCDLTDVWENISERYIPMLVGSRGNATLVNCSGCIFPSMNSEWVSVYPPHPHHQDHHPFLCHELGRPAEVFQTPREVHFLAL